MPRTRRSALAMIQSANDRNSDTTTTMTNTMAVVVRVSFRDGQVTLEVSWRTSWMNFAGLTFAMRCYPRGGHILYVSLRRPGRSGGARTPSPRFWRPVLYQLSYTPKRTAP